MFVRFRKRKSRLQVSLIETRRVDGKVRHEHIASFGSVPVPPEVADRIAFWQRLHERLARLSNRVDAAMQGKILGDVHARIAMVTADEQRALQLENAEADERFWASMQSISAGTAEDHKRLAAKVADTIATGEASALEAQANAMLAKERIERIKRREAVEGGLGKPRTREDWDRWLRANGTDPDHCVQLHEISKAIGFETMVKAMRRETDRAERSIVRKLHRAHCR